MKTSFLLFVITLLSACQASNRITQFSVKNEIEASDTFAAKCQIQLANAQSRSLIAMSPSLAATIDDEGDSNVTLSLDLMDGYRADLTREITLANCKYDEVLTFAKVISRLNASKISRNSHIARAQKITAGSSAFSRKLNQMVVDGSIKQAAYNKLSKSIRNLQKQADKSLQKVAALQPVNLEALPTYEELESQLLTSLGDAQGRRLKGDFFRNVRLNVSGGLDLENQDDTVASNQNNALDSFGKITLTVKLGIFTPQFNAAQARLHDAELGKLYEANTGILWQLQNLHITNQVSERFLLRERSAIIKEIAALKNSIGIEKKADKIFAARIAILLLEADLIRVDSNLKELRILIRKLSGSIFYD